MVAYNIKWDTDGHRIKGLPKRVEIPNHIINEMEDENDIDVITDYLSDEYGFCVEGYELE